MKLKDYFDEIRAEDYTETFSSTERWLRNTAAQNLRNQLQKQRKGFDIMTYIKFHKLRVVYALLLIVVISIACNLPVEQTETLGYVLRWTVKGDTQTSRERLNQFDWLEYNTLTVSQEELSDGMVTTYRQVLTDMNKRRAKKCIKELETVKEVIGIQLYPLEETVTRPMYAAALNSVFRVDIDATGMSDEELSQAIEDQLNAAGMEDVDVNFISLETSGDRKLALDFDKLKSLDGAGEQTIVMTLKEGEIAEDIDIDAMTGEFNFSFEDMDFRGKTEEEIKEMVEAKLKEEGLEDMEIKVIRKDIDGEEACEISIMREMEIYGETSEAIKKSRMKMFVSEEETDAQNKKQRRIIVKSKGKESDDEEFMWKNDNENASENEKKVEVIIQKDGEQKNVEVEVTEEKSE